LVSIRNPNYKEHIR